MVLLNLNSRQNLSTGIPQDFEVNYPVPLEFPSSTEVALIGCNMWYSWHNISKEYNTNELKYFDGTKWDTIIFPEGNYDFDDIQDYINDHFKTDDPPISIHANTVTLRTIVLLKANYKIDLTYGELHKLLGFEPGIIDKDKCESKYKADITRGVDRILIHCSIVGGTYENSFESDVIYSFVPNNSPGSMLDIQPFHPIYLPLKETMIRKIRMKITDQNTRPIDLNNQHVDYLLNIRPMVS